MKLNLTTLLLLSALCPALAQTPDRQADRILFDLTNQLRTEHHLSPFLWDPALAAAAQAHALRQSAEAGALEHQYPGEPDLLTRASHAGAHFSIISENLARGRTSPIALEQLWMTTPVHRANLLNPQLTAIGIAVLNRNGILYAVQDLSRAAPSLSTEAIELHVVQLLQEQGLHTVGSSPLARAACQTRATTAPEARLIVQWDGDVSQLPAALLQQLQQSQFHSATVGACPGSQPGSGFTSARVAVLLF